MDFESPDVEKDFPGLYASESGKKSNESDFSDETHDKISKKDLLIGKRKDKKDSKKDRGYATLEGESSPEEDVDVKSPSKSKKSKPFKFPSAKKEKREKSREKDIKDKDVDKEKDKKKENDRDKKKDAKVKLKLKEKKKLKHNEESCDVGEEHPIFGVPLHTAVERSKCHDGVEIPLVVRDCIDLVQEIGLNVEGVYKLSGIKSRVQYVRRLYNQREPVCLSDYDLPVATSLLKTFLRELPEPVVTSELLPKFEEAASVKEVSVRVAELKALCDRLSACNRQMLAWIIKHLDCVASHEKYNKMNAQCIATTLSPVLQMSQRLLHVFLCHCASIFPNTKLTKYIPPLSCGSPSLPDTAAAIVDELRKQESLLEQIHCEMNAGLVTKNREEQLWEVQRIITQLKRKLRTLEKAAESTQQRSIDKDEHDGESGKQEEETAAMTKPSNQHVVEAVIESRPESVALAETQVVPSATDKMYNLPKEELALCLETEELTSLATSLQALVENEKAEINRLRSQIRALGGNPVYSNYYFDRFSGDTKHIDSDEWRLVNRENAALQAQKNFLIESIMEERQACVSLRVQIKLTQMSKC